MPSLIKTLQHFRDARRIKRMKHAIPNNKAVYHAWLQLERYPRSYRDQPLEIELGETTLHGQNWEELSYLFTEVFINNDYFTRSRITGPYIIDCGANIGMATVYFKLLYPNAKIQAFEPNPYCFDVLGQNVKENDLDDVTLVKAGCSNQAGRTTFHVNPGFSPMSSMDSTRNKDAEAIEVELVKLSDHINRPVDILKMDIEGGEWDVMDDLVTSGKIDLVDRMFIEYHHRIGSPEVRFGRFLRIIEEAGYTYSLTTNMNLDRRFTGVFQDVMIYAVKMDKVDPKD